MKKTIEVVAAVIYDGDKVFCTQRPNRGELALKWEFPGGKVEAGETREEALKREIREELNSEVIVEEYLLTVEHEYNTFHLTMHCFKCKLLTGNLDLNEHVSSRWIGINALMSLDFADADISIVVALQNNK